MSDEQHSYTDLWEPWRLIVMVCVSLRSPFRVWDSSFSEENLGENQTRDPRLAQRVAKTSDNIATMRGRAVS